MNEYSELVNVDNDDPAAVVNWVRGMCRGRSVNQLAEFYEVSPTIEAVAAVLAGDLPDQTRQVAIEACMDELRKSQK